MGLKAPSILTFMLSVVLVVAVVIAKFFGATIPLLTGHEFWAMLVAFIVLMLGCVLRGM